MTISIYKVSGGGDISPVAFSGEAATLNAASRLLPGGVYTTFRTYEGSKVLSLEQHLRRLEESAELLGHPLSLARDTLRQALRRVLESYHNGEARLRLTVDLDQEPGTLYLSLESLVSPTPVDYAWGVRTVTCRQQRENPRAKQTAFISVAEAIRKELPEGVHEGLIVDDEGVILEGLSSNFFGVKSGVLFTAAEAVLSGITRSLVLDAAQRTGMPVIMEGVKVEEIPVLDETFLTSSTRGVLPVRQVDEQLVGNGQVGPVTQALSRAYVEEILRRVEAI